MLSNRVMNVKPSPTTELTGRIAQLSKKGEKIIRFNVGEPDHPTPEHICQAAVRAMEQGFTKYTSAVGVPELREAICDKLGRENGCAYSADEVIIGAGAKQCLSAALLAICNPLDEVIIPYPCWVSYTELVRLADGVPVMVPCKEDFSLDLSAIEEAVTKKTKAIMINTPNNPTGAVYARETLERVAQLAVAHDFYILADEVYEKFIYGEGEHVSVASFSREVKERTIVINSFSKTYAMTGWRIGYAAAPREIIRGMNTIQSQVISSVQSLSQKAAVAALTQTQEPVRRMVSEFKKRKDYMVGRFAKMEGVFCENARGAFYLLPDIRSYIGRSDNGIVIEDDYMMAEYLLKEAKIAAVPGSAFLIPGHLRFAYTNSMEQIKLGMDAMERALGRLR